MYGLKLNSLDFKMAKHKKKHKKKNHHQYYRRRNRKDRISELPDDVLVLILSLLPGTEAVATCVLSRRWEKLWTFTTGTLTFSHPTKWPMVKTKSDEDKIKPEFINWVNHALRVHQGPTLQEFCIEFSLDQLFASDIDIWINFAIRKKVQRLHFDFLRWTDNDEKHYYNFPNLNTLRLRDKCGFSNFISSLTELCLAHLNVNESLLEYFLSDCCPNLEKLCLESSCSLVNLRVAAPPKLKHLEISSCYNLENIEIAAPNLMFLKYNGDATIMTLKNVPKLVEAQLSDIYDENLINTIPGHLNSLSQLEALTLCSTVFWTPRWSWIRRIPKLLNLKRLVLVISASDNESLLPCTHLLKAAPFLHTFVMKFFISCSKQQNIREVGEDAKYQHQYLKVVELSGFAGLPIDVEIASQLIETAISLEKITIDTNYGKNRLEAKERANQLKEKLPAGAELVVL